MAQQKRTTGAAAGLATIQMANDAELVLSFLKYFVLSPSIFLYEI